MVTPTDSQSTIGVAMTEEQLDLMLDQGVKPKEETKERLSQFFQWRMKSYTTYQWKNSDLAETFSMDFEHFDQQDFASLGNDNIHALRNRLRAHGVYVKKQRFYSISQALINTVREELP